MTITGGEEGSTLPPSQRDLTDLPAWVRTQSRNLRAQGQGFTSGRMITPRAVTDTSDDGEGTGAGDGSNADDTQYEWEYDDRHAVTATGTQVASLTFIPVEESLFVHWHPGGGAGRPVLNEDFTVEGNVVTIPDPGYLETGDTFSFQYQFDPAEEDAPDEPPAEVTLYGVTVASSGQSTIAIPPGTPEGATLVLMMSIPTGFGPVTFSDARFDPTPYFEVIANISDTVRIGTADGTSTPVPITLLSVPAGTYGYAILASFSPMTLGTPAPHLNEPSLPLTFDPVTAFQALGFVFSRYNVVPGSLSNGSTDGWDTVAIHGSGGSVGMFLFTPTPPVAGTTEPGAIGYSGALGSADTVTAPISV